MTFYSSGRSLRQLLQCLRSHSVSATPYNSSWIQSILSSSGSAQILSGSSSTSSSSSSRCLCRAFSDYAAPGRGAAGSSLRRVNPGGRSANGSSAADGAASTSGEPSVSINDLTLQTYAVNTCSDTVLCSIHAAWDLLPCSSCSSAWLAVAPHSSNSTLGRPHLGHACWCCQDSCKQAPGPP
jgi:hypothetical protein